MNILITGGTGFLGTPLVEALAQDGHIISVLTRSKRTSKNRQVSYIEWNGKELPPAMGFYDVVINLAGSSIGESGWSESAKQEMVSSRLDATNACVKFINKSTRPPSLFISGSAVGYYGGFREGEMTETSAPADDFMADLCLRWEAAAQEAKCRTIILRTGVVLGNEGGVIPKLKPIYKFWLGGKLGNGKQGFPWIHLDDEIAAIRFLMDHESAEGAYNLCGPEIVNQETFSDTYAQALNVMDIWTVPKFALKMLLGERSILLWGGQTVSSKKLQSLGFEFKFPTVKEALVDLV